MRAILIILLLCLNINSYSQKVFSLKDLFIEKSIVWYGVDYSKCKFIGLFEKLPDDSLRLNEYFHEWNNLYITEPEKFDLAHFFKKENVLMDITSIEKINSETKPIFLKKNNPITLSGEDRLSMVSKYESEKRNEGIGAAFIADAYDRKKNIGSHYIVVFDIASKKILISQKYTVKPYGFGIRNYWATTMFYALRSVSDNYWGWRNKIK